jgi:CBS domain containing-hemolysin-like protein
MEGRTDLEVLEELLEIDFDAEELPYETVNGLICDKMGRVPSIKESCTAFGLEFSVEAADERKVTSVLVQKISQSAVMNEE